MSLMRSSREFVPGSLWPIFKVTVDNCQKRLCQNVRCKHKIKYQNHFAENRSLGPTFTTEMLLIPRWLELIT